MTITFSPQAFWELFEEELEHPHLSQSDTFDRVYAYPAPLGKGYWRNIDLREGIELAIAQYHLYSDFVLHLPERSHPLEFTLLLETTQRGGRQSIKGGHYQFFGSGMAPREAVNNRTSESVIDINVHIDPDVFRAWWGIGSDLSTSPLKPLFRSCDQKYFTHSGTLTAAMQMAVQHILQCPYQGFTKRMYLESKVWELMALLLDDVTQEQSCTTTRPTLKPEDVERIHQARNILLQQFENPPSLLELARQVGLNDCTLKRGFRQVFGTTAFGLLHDYRLEHARQLLDTRDFNISEVARSVGIANRSYFASAFRKKFGVSPREYLSSDRNSA
jgi:AraC-like DNA-binding protein